MFIFINFSGVSVGVSLHLVERLRQRNRQRLIKINSILFKFSRIGLSKCFGTSLCIIIINPRSLLNALSLSLTSFAPQVFTTWFTFVSLDILLIIDCDNVIFQNSLAPFVVKAYQRRGRLFRVIHYWESQYLLRYNHWPTF